MPLPRLRGAELLEALARLEGTRDGPNGRPGEYAEFGE
jgi:hypothetical protein